MKRDRVAVWLDAVDEHVRWLKNNIPPKERGKVIREALTLYREGKRKVDENAVIVGKAVLSQIQLAFPDREIDDDLILSILVKGIRKLREEEKERERIELLKLSEV